MSKPIHQNIPDAEKLLEMETDELAGYVMEHLHSVGGNPLKQGFSRPNNLADSIASSYPSNKEDIVTAIYAACQWLLNRDFLVVRNSQGFFDISKKGNNIKTADNLRAHFNKGESDSVSVSVRELKQDAHEESKINQGTQEHKQQQAATALATSPKTQSNELTLPETATLAWLFSHVSVSVWLWFGGAIVTAFMLGVTVGQTTFFQELFGRERTPPVVSPVLTEQKNKTPPKVFIAAYKTENGEEYWYDEVFDVPSDKVIHASGFIDYELPLKVINDSGVDAEEIVVWIKSDAGELTFPQGWREESYADQIWKVKRIKPLSPHSAIKVYSIKLHIKEDTKEVKLLWKLYAKGALPNENIIFLRF